MVGSRSASFDGTHTSLLQVRLDDDDVFRFGDPEVNEVVTDVGISIPAPAGLTTYSTSVYPLRTTHQDAADIGFEHILRGIKATVYLFEVDPAATEMQVGTTLVLACQRRPDWLLHRGVLVGRLTEIGPRSIVGSDNRFLHVNLVTAVFSAGGRETKHALVEAQELVSAGLSDVIVYPVDSGTPPEKDVFEERELWSGGRFTAYRVSPPSMQNEPPVDTVPAPSGS